MASPRSAYRDLVDVKDLQSMREKKQIEII